MSSLTSKYLGRPITQLPSSMQQSLSMSSLDLSMGAAAAAMGGPSLDLDLLSGGGSSSGMPAAFQPVSDMERPMMADMATRAMDELIRLAQAGDHVWAKADNGGCCREVLSVDAYDTVFGKPGGSRGPDVHVEGSRDSCLVLLPAHALVDIFMDSVSTASQFRPRAFFLISDRHLHGLAPLLLVVVSEQMGGLLPHHRGQGAHGGRPRQRHGRPERVFGSGKIISKTKSIAPLHCIMINHPGDMNRERELHYTFRWRQMQEELHVMTPVVPTRELCFLRYCRQIEQGLWAVADVSVDLLQQRDHAAASRYYGAPPQARARKLPSGCLIADMSNGYSKVTWVEHMETTEGDNKNPINPLYRDLVLSGAAFGAHRWLAALQRACDRHACLVAASMPHRDIAAGGNSYTVHVYMILMSDDILDRVEFDVEWDCSDGGREEEHDEAVGADGEQLLREPERVAGAPVDDAFGPGVERRRRRRRRGARHGAPEHGPGAAQRRRAQRRHIHLAPRPLRPRLRLRPRREHTIPGPKTNSNPAIMLL